MIYESDNQYYGIGQKTNVSLIHHKFMIYSTFCKLLKTTSYMHIGVDMEAYFRHGIE